MIELNVLEHIAELKVTKAREDISAYIEKLGNDPSYTLEWGVGLFEAAARVKVWEQILAKKGERAAPDISIMLTFADIALREAIYGARWPERSTEPCSRLMHECLTAEWASLYVEIMGGV
jgi:hypothetical protein